MQWLTFEDAKRIGLQVTSIDEPTVPDEPNVSTAHQPSDDAYHDWSVAGEWIQTFSRLDRQEAITLADGLSRKFEDVSVFSYDNGWYVVAIGPYVPGTAHSARDRLWAASAIPLDSIVNPGKRFVERVWSSAASGLPSPAAFAENLNLSGNNRWVAIASRQDLGEAIEIARGYSIKVRGSSGQGMVGSRSYWVHTKLPTFSIFETITEAQRCRLMPGSRSVPGIWRPSGHET